MLVLAKTLTGGRVIYWGEPSRAAAYFAERDVHMPAHYDVSEFLSELAERSEGFNPDVTVRRGRCFVVCLFVLVSVRSLSGNRSVATPADVSSSFRARVQLERLADLWLASDEKRRVETEVERLCYIAERTKPQPLPPPPAAEPQPAQGQEYAQEQQQLPHEQQHAHEQQQQDTHEQQPPQQSQQQLPPLLVLSPSSPSSSPSPSPSSAVTQEQRVHSADGSAASANRSASGTHRSGAESPHSDGAVRSRSPTEQAEPSHSAADASARATAAAGDNDVSAAGGAVIDSEVPLPPPTGRVPTRNFAVQLGWLLYRDFLALYVLRGAAFLSVLVVLFGSLAAAAAAAAVVVVVVLQRSTLSTLAFHRAKTWRIQLMTLVVTAVFAVITGAYVPLLMRGAMRCCRSTYDALFLSLSPSLLFCCAGRYFWQLNNKTNDVRPRLGLLFYVIVYAGYQALSQVPGMVRVRVLFFLLLLVP